MNTGILQRQRGDQANERYKGEARPVRFRRKSDSGQQAYDAPALGAPRIKLINFDQLDETIEARA
jgi:hypothetical protein